MASDRKWQFKTKFRANAYGWRGSRLAIDRLKEAAAEISSVAKSDPVGAGDGVVSLMERIWPAFQGIDTSSGALGGAVFRTVTDLVPILTAVGGGYDPSVSEVDDAVKHLLAASRQIGWVEWALRELGKSGERRCAPGREPFQHAMQAALSRWHPVEPGA